MCAFEGVLEREKKECVLVMNPREFTAREREKLLCVSVCVNLLYPDHNSYQYIQDSYYSSPSSLLFYLASSV